MHIEKKEIGRGISLFVNDVSKFKTATLSMYLHCPLNEQDVTKNALLPFVLKRGFEAIPTSEGIYRYLEDMYGAKFDCGVRKKGEDQIICFNLEFISDAYAPQKEAMAQKAVWFLMNLLFSPVIQNGGFLPDYVAQEKENLKNLIASLKNDKRDYAVERCEQELCKDEPYGLYQFGLESRVDEITPQGLYERYQEIIKNAKIDVFLSGGINPEEVRKALEDRTGFRAEGQYTYPQTKQFSGGKQVRTVTEKLHVEQGKLSLGFRAELGSTPEEFYAAAICNSVFGGGPHSKLFNNVREKLSLAYYVFSRLYRLKSIMVVSSGVEIDSFQKAYDEILLQLKELQAGKLDEKELAAAKSYYINALNSFKDSVFGYEDFYLTGLLTGDTRDLDQIIAIIQKVTAVDVVQAAKGIVLDTVYYLTKSDEEGKA